MSDFRDFIPAGIDPGALGDGFTDFVPPIVTREAVATPDEVETTEEFICDTCEQSFKSKAGLASHTRAHKE